MKTLCLRMLILAAAVLFLVSPATAVIKVFVRSGHDFEDDDGDRGFWHEDWEGRFEGEGAENAESTEDAEPTRGLEDVVVSQSANVTVMIANRGRGALSLTVSAISLDKSSSKEFKISSLPTTPFTLAPHTSNSLTVSFTPTVTGSATATLHVTSNDTTTPTVDVTLIGVGSKTSQFGIDQITSFFDSATAAQPPTLQGTTGWWPGMETARLNMFRNMLVEAQQFDTAGETEEAWFMLNLTYQRCDGLPSPKDYITGSALSTLAKKIQDAINSIPKPL